MNFTTPPKELDNKVSDLQKALINDLSWLLKESNDYNMILNVGESPNIKSFKVHSSVLRARSLYFRAILSSNHHTTSNGKSPLIQITQANIKPEVFDVMLKYLYTGNISIEDEKDAKKLFEYIIAAENLWLFPLVQYIENYLLNQMKDWLNSNLVYVLTMIQSNPSSFKSLSEFSNGILKDRPYSLFDSDDFHTLPEPTLINLLQRRNFSKEITEKKLLSAVLDWGIKQYADLVDKEVHNWTSSDFNKLQTRLQHCIPLIRFTNIPPEVFFEIIGPYKRIFTSGHYERIMQIPTFAAYNKLMRSPSPRPTSPKSKLQPTFPSTPLLASLLRGFPKPPSRRSTITNKKSPPQSVSSANGYRSASPASDSLSVSPANDSRSVSPANDSRSVSPANDYLSVTPENDSRSVSPANGSRSVSPANDYLSVTPANDSRSVSPANDSRSVSPANGSRSVSPANDYLSVTPANDSRSVSPVNDYLSVTPANGSRSVSPVNDYLSVSPVNGSRSVSPVNDSRSVSPSPVYSNSTNPSRPIQQQQSSTIVRSKYVIKKQTRSFTFDKPKVSLVDRAQTVPILSQKKSNEISVYSIENSNKISSPIKTNLKKSSNNSSSERPDSAVLELVSEYAEFSTERSFEPVVDTSISRKNLNRKKSIVKRSRVSASNWNKLCPVMN